MDVLTRVDRGELADRAYSRAAEGLVPRDRHWLQELVYGTLRLRGRLDYLLAAFVRGGTTALDPVVLNVLRLGVYQLLEMGSVPSYAAVSQSVELARAAGAARAAGLVNGVLQALRRGVAEVRFPSFEVDPIEHLTTWGSHPRWLVERWLNRWGPDETLRLVEANNGRPELFLRPIGISPAGAVERLVEQGIPAESVPEFPDSVRVMPPGSPTEALGAVRAVVQDPAAAMVVRYAEFPEGALVLDVSAAPGGKAIALADRAGLVVAADITSGRLQRLQANVARLGLHERVVPVVADGRTPPFRPAGAVLLDTPCTGTGTLRRHPDGRWRLGPADLEALVALQRELLAAAAGLVSPGGLLVYATCSLEPEENEAQVEWFLDRHPGFRLAAPEGSFDGTMIQGGLLNVRPQLHGVDGAFSARMMRSA